MELGIQPQPAAAEASPQPVEGAGETAGAEVVVEKAKPRRATVTLDLLAKYPILPEMGRFLSGIDIREMTMEVFERATERVVEALERGEVKRAADSHYVEALSYPAAVMLLTAVGDEWLKRR